MKEFGYPVFDENGEEILCTYSGDYSHMNMDVRVYRMNNEDKKLFCRDDEECAVLLMKGEVEFRLTKSDKVLHAKRESVFVPGSYAAHVSAGYGIEIECFKDGSEILVQCTKNTKFFEGKLYEPENVPFHTTGKGEMGDHQVRQVNTIFGKESEPESNMVLGEILNNPGCWSGYPPHRHPQPELYYFRIDHKDGFGASFVDDKVYKIVDNSYSAIPGGAVHPQSVAPGFRLWTAWMIRHNDDDPWLETSRFEDSRYSFLHDVK